MTELTTPRLRVRPFDPADLDEFLAFHAHPEVARTVGKPPMDRERATRYLSDQTALGDEVRGQWHGYAIVVEGRVIGEVGLYLQEDPVGEADLGFALHPEFQGRGYATGAAEALLRQGFEKLSLQRVTAHCDETNVASFRLMERVGLRRVVQFEPGLAYALSRDEWLVRNN